MKKTNEFWGFFSLALLMVVSYLVFFLLPGRVAARYPAVLFPSVFYIRLAGYILLAAGVVLWVGAVIILRVKGKGTPHPTVNPTKIFVDRYFYKYTRHPIYLGFVTMIFSVGLIQSNYFTMWLVVIVLLVICSFIIPPEEKYLSEKFGNAYKHYMDEVPVFLPVKIQAPFIEKRLGAFWITFVAGTAIIILFVISPLFPCRISGSDALNSIVALLLLLIGIASFGSAVYLFIKKGKGLKRTGPYKYVRNPMYAGLFLVYLSLAFWYNSLFSVFAFLFIYLLANYYVAIIKEKKQAVKYGAEFYSFKNEIGRFFPKINFNK